MEPTVKTIDFAGFLNGENAKGIANDILESFKTIGFVCLTKHGLEQKKVDEIFEWSKKFFDLPLEAKQLAPHPPSGDHHRGYSSMGREKVVHHGYDDDTLASAGVVPQTDPKESFESGREDDPLMPNVWLPEGILPGFKEACLDFYWACYELEKNVLRALAVAFSLPEDWFLQFHKAADNQLRMLHYPPVPAEDLINEKYSRISAHSDFGTMTLLFQDKVGGLEVEDPQTPGNFIPVPVVPNSVVVNVADLMMRWSNDIIKSSVHRVRAPPGLTEDGVAPARYSVVYFYCCDMSAIVDAIPGTWDEAHPKKYKPISAKDYVLKRLAANY